MWPLLQHSPEVFSEFQKREDLDAKRAEVPEVGEKFLQLREDKVSGVNAFKHEGEVQYLIARLLQPTTILGSWRDY